jgi:hypothetical protein
MKTTLKWLQEVESTNEPNDQLADKSGIVFEFGIRNRYT